MTEKTWFYICVTIPDSCSEIIVSIFYDYHCLGIEESDQGGNVTLKGFFDSSDDADVCSQALKNLFYNIDMVVPVHVESILDPGWNTSWHPYFRPVEIGNSFVIFPPWDPVSSTRRLGIEINPGQAFGTGHHETTTLCLELLETVDVSDRIILDAGCGSGVLGIAASLLGAKQIVGLDLDPVAVQEAVTNARTNLGDRRTTWITGDLNALRAQRYYGVLANLNRPTLLKNAAALSRFIVPEGFLILSGFLNADIKDILAAFRKNGLFESVLVHDGEWSAALLRPESV